MRKAIYGTVAAVIILMGVFAIALGVRGAEQNYKIETSPDGAMWTMVEEIPEDERYTDWTVADNSPSFWYDSNSDFVTGIQGGVAEIGAGEHYFTYDRNGVIPVGKWCVEQEYAYCVSGWKKENEAGHGIKFLNQMNCGLPYFSGWMPYCADCGEKILPTTVNLSKGAVKTLKEINVDLGYYYICPCSKPIYKQIEYEDAYDEDGIPIQRPVEYEIVGYTECGHLEKYWEATPHRCKAVSPNRYRVVYDANASGVKGSMAYSIHMYNNSVVFEGEQVTPIRTLSLCTYDRSAEGYLFSGWNTKPDGTGDAFADGAEIYNLTKEHYTGEPNTDKGTVILYAQWKRVESTLTVDANGGSYQDINPIVASWGKEWFLNPEKLIPPAGYTVSLQLNGGNALCSEMTSTKSFHAWKLNYPANGLLVGNIYRFTGANGLVDTVQAIYASDPIILPVPEKNNYSFGGWYTDEQCSRLAGYGGEPYIPTEDTTLYAKWVKLQMIAMPDYSVAGGIGAVNLNWIQQDNTLKTYRIYRKAEGENGYKQVYNAQDEEHAISYNKEFGLEGIVRILTIPANGFYYLSAYGAQGAGYGNYTGGLGGSVDAMFYLSKGEVISIVVGGTDSTNGGGLATAYGNGGGCTIIRSDRKGILLVAGGGGGATDGVNGLAGGNENGLLVEQGMIGQYGVSGGGGGYLGGIAGNKIVHEHSVENGCYADTSYDVLSPDYGIMPIEAEWDDYQTDIEGNILRDYNYRSQQFGSLENLIPVNGNKVLDIGAWVYSDGNNYIDESSCIEVRNQNNEMLFSASVGELRKQWENLGFTQQSFESNQIYYDWSDLPLAYVNIYDTWDYSDTSGGRYDIFVKSDICYTLFKEDGTCQLAKVTLDENHGNPIYFGDYDDAYYPTYNFFESGMEGYEGYNCKPLLFQQRSFWYGTSGAHFKYRIELPEGTTGIYVYAVGMIDTLSDGRTTPFGNNVFFDELKLSGGLRLECDRQNILTPAYGGSNYINPEYAFAYQRKEGVQRENGSAQVSAKVTGLVEATALSGVSAPDCAAPDKIMGYDLKASDTDWVTIKIYPTKDNGTRYYFKAESYSAVTGNLTCESNIAECELISGIKGYLYVVDERRDTVVTNNHSFVSLDNACINVQLKEMVRFVHVAVIDYAGNISETIHIPLDKKDIKVAWELATDKVQISSIVGGHDYGGVYPAKERDTYFVRADDASPFLLSYDSKMNGTPRDDYQIDYQVLEVRTADGVQKCGIKVPHTDIGVECVDLDVANFRQWTVGPHFLSDAAYLGVVRSRIESAERLSYYRAFYLSSQLHGQTLTVMPIAGATFGEVIKYSNPEKDELNEIRLIADAEAPQIIGLEMLSQWMQIDREEAEFNMQLTAVDELSGVNTFWVEIENQDNALKKSYMPGADGTIELKLTEAEAVFAGDFTVTVYAVDNVGNDSRKSIRVTECALMTEVYRMLAPHEPVFKRGESGVLSIETWGYAEKVEVIFPESLEAYNCTYIYSQMPEHIKRESIQFMIPLDTKLQDGIYQIVVRAHKGEVLLEDVLTIRIYGTILDEVRTRLR